MRLTVYVCNVCEEQFSKDRATRSLILNGQVLDICSAQCAVRLWERMYWQSSEISIITTQLATEQPAVKFKVVE